MRRLYTLLAAIAAAGLLVIAVLAPHAAAAGWLIGFVTCAAPVLGAVALTLIGALTGGRWRGCTASIAGAAPGLLLLWLPVALALSWIYPWFDAAPAAGSAAAYLHPTFYVGRTLGALVLWGAMGWMLAHARPTRLLMGLALLVHAGLVVMVGVDWILSLQPGWMSSDFGMNLAAQQIAAGAAVSLLTAGPETGDGEVRDLASLVVAGVLGVAYLAFMDYLIIWYGDLPDRVTWYLAREGGAGRLLVLGGLIVGAVAPPLLLAAPRVARRMKAAMAAVCALVGLLLYQLYLLKPLLGWKVLLAAALALVLQAMLLATVARWAPTSLRRWGLAHG